MRGAQQLRVRGRMIAGRKSVSHGIPDIRSVCVPVRRGVLLRPVVVLPLTQVPPAM